MKNSAPVLQELIVKFQSGNITPEEEQLLLEWYDQLNVVNQPAWQSAKQEARTRRTLRKQIERRLSDIRPVRSLIRPMKAWWAAAAVAATLIVLLSVWYFQKVNPANNHLNNSLAPIWTSISNDGNTCKKVKLPDGSYVWMNIGSHLRFNDRFGEENRLIYADGELLLDVRPDTKTPFSLVTANITTTVLGTRFNVESYPDEKEIKVSLLQGKVSVTDGLRKSHVLLPGQMAAGGTANEMTVSDIGSAHPEDWVHGALVFDETLLSDALHRIERKYPVKFSYASDLVKEQRITSLIPDGDNWPSILQTMLYIHNIRMKQTGNIIHLYR